MEPPGKPDRSKGEINRTFDLSGAVILTLFKPCVQLAFGKIERPGLFDAGNLITLDEAVNGGYSKPQEDRGFSNGKECKSSEAGSELPDCFEEFV